LATQLPRIVLSIFQHYALGKHNMIASGHTVETIAHEDYGPHKGTVRMTATFSPRYRLASSYIVIATEHIVVNEVVDMVGSFSGITYSFTTIHLA
jgi:hypothetical protein